VTNGSVQRKTDSAKLSAVRFALCALSLCSLVWASSKEDLRNELPTPSNLQAVVLKKSISLAWQWQAPEELPAFTDFGYEIERQDGKRFFSAAATWTDSGLVPGSYAYVVRARGVVKEHGRRIIYVSDWTAPAEGSIKISCQRAPTIEMNAEPTQKELSTISSLRFHIRGQASVDKGCTLEAVTYHLDTGAGVVHTGPLPVDANGRFDAFVNAYGPEDELPTGHESFSITAKAEDEAGPVISSVYSVDLDIKSRFAPDKPYNTM
jgi:hypothetical protein